MKAREIAAEGSKEEGNPSLMLVRPTETSDERELEEGLSHHGETEEGSKQETADEEDVDTEAKEKDEEDTEGDEDHMEGKKSIGRRPPRTPTKAEREEHARTHCPYRSWCEHCVKSRARNAHTVRELSIQNCSKKS